MRNNKVKIFLWLFMILIPIWLIMSEAEESDLIFYTGLVLIITVIAIGVITNKF